MDRDGVAMRPSPGQPGQVPPAQRLKYNGQPRLSIMSLHVLVVASSGYVFQRFRCAACAAADPGLVDVCGPASLGFSVFNAQPLPPLRVLWTFAVLPSHRHVPGEKKWCQRPHGQLMQSLQHCAANQVGSSLRPGTQFDVGFRLHLGVQCCQSGSYCRTRRRVFQAANFAKATLAFALLAGPSPPPLVLDSATRRGQRPQPRPRLVPAELDDRKIVKSPQRGSRFGTAAEWRSTRHCSLHCLPSSAPSAAATRLPHVCCQLSAG